MKKLSTLAFMMILLMAMIPFLATPVPAGYRYKPLVGVIPHKVTYTGPCHVSEQFEVEVWIFNQNMETGELIYGFEFMLLWDSSLIELKEDEIEIKPLWPEGEYYCFYETGEINRTFTFEHPNLVDLGYPCEEVVLNNLPEGWDYFRMVMTALDTTEPWEGKAPVVNLFFHILKEPCYPDVFWSPFRLEDTTLSTACGDPIVHWTEDSIYEYWSSKPEMAVTIPEGKIDDKGTTDPSDDTYYIVKWTNCSWFTVEITVKNVVKMYDFEFHLYYNSTLLNTDVQHIHIKDFLPPPYEEQVIKVFEAEDPWMDLDCVYVKIVRPCEKPPISCEEGAIVNIEFHTKCPTKKPYPFPFKPPITPGPGVYIAPISAWSPLDLVGAKISTKCPKLRLYREMTLDTRHNGTAALMTGVNHLGATTQDIINLTAPYVATGTPWWCDEASVHILPQPCMTLNDFVSMSWWVKTVKGYPPHLDLTVSDGVLTRMLTAEFAYQPYVGPGYNYAGVQGVPYGRFDWPGSQAASYWPDHGQWRPTFHAPTAWGVLSTIECTSIHDKTIFWSNDGPSNPWGGAGNLGYFAKLADWKIGSVDNVDNAGPLSGINGTWHITDIQIEVDCWIKPTEAHVDEIVLNGVRIARNNVYSGDYWFIPLPEDLDQSGHVDIRDLKAIASHYCHGLASMCFPGMTKSQTCPFDLNGDGHVDILDIVMVAKKFCKPYTPEDPITEEPYDP